MYPKKKELPDMKVDLPDFAGALEAIAINKQHDLFVAEINRRAMWEKINKIIVAWLGESDAEDKGYFGIAEDICNHFLLGLEGEE